MPPPPSVLIKEEGSPKNHSVPCIKAIRKEKIIQTLLPVPSKVQKIHRNKSSWQIKQRLESQNTFDAHMCYQHSRREILRQINPELSWNDIMEIIGKEWSKMTSKEKRVYVNQVKDEDSRNHIQ